MNIQTIEVESPFGVQVQHRFHYHDPVSDKLLIILPGRGYTVNHPVLFHLTYLALQNGFDVLPVQYGFQISGSLEPQQIPLLQEDVRLATEPVLERGYREICIAGKSLGSPLALDLAQMLDVEALSLILLTPVGAAMQANTGTRTLSIIGTADALYSADVVRVTDGKVTWRVFENLSHSLIDENDWRHSMRALEEILEACEMFLRGEL